jgi:hypothetical protein
MPTQKRVSELPAITGVTGTDLLIVSSNSSTKRVAISQIGTYFASAGVAGPTGASSTVTGPAGGVGATGAASTVTGPTGASSTVAGPTGEAGAASNVTGPTGAIGSGQVYATGPTAPASANDGEAWIDTDNGKYYVRYAGVWVEFGFMPTGLA